jgi:hypothetical protein
MPIFRLDDHLNCRVGLSLLAVGQHRDNCKANQFSGALPGPHP